MCGCESTAITAISSSEVSISMAPAAPRFAMSIFVRPPPAPAIIDPDLSITIASAMENLRCSCRSSSETGSMSSTAVLYHPPGPNDLSPPASATPRPRSVAYEASSRRKDGWKSFAGTLSRSTPP